MTDTTEEPQKVDRSTWFSPDAVHNYFGHDYPHPRIMAMLNALPAIADECDRLRAQVAERGERIERFASMLTERDEKIAGLNDLINEVPTFARRTLDVESALRTCEAERDKLREDAELQAAVNRAASELPGASEIAIHIENGAGWVEVWDDYGDIQHPNYSDLSLACQVQVAIDAALAQREP